jgi:hypothetical protein
MIQFRIRSTIGALALVVIGSACSSPNSDAKPTTAPNAPAISQATTTTTQARTTTVSEVNILAVMVDHLFSWMVVQSEREDSAPQDCIDQGGCDLPTSGGLIVEGGCIFDDSTTDIDCTIGGVVEGDADYVAIDGLQYVDTLFLGLEALGFSQSIEAKIGNTRAIDGMQTAQSPDGFTATWTFHPDDGLNVIVEKSQ